MTDRNDVLKPSARRQPDRGKPVPSEFSVLADFFSSVTLNLGWLTTSASRCFFFDLPGMAGCHARHRSTANPPFRLRSRNLRFSTHLKRCMKRSTEKPRKQSSCSRVNNQQCDHWLDRFGRYSFLGRFSKSTVHRNPGHAAFQLVFQASCPDDYLLVKTDRYRLVSNYPGAATYNINLCMSASRHLGFRVQIANPTGRTSLQPCSGIAHTAQNLRLPPFPVVHFPKILPSPVSRCVSLPSVLVSPRRCQPNDTTLTGRSGKQLSGRPYGGCTCGHACVRRILLFPPVCQPTYSCHPPFDSGGCRPSNGSNSC